MNYINKLFLKLSISASSNYDNNSWINNKYLQHSANRAFNIKTFRHNKTLYILHFMSTEFYLNIIITIINITVYTTWIIIQTKHYKPLITNCIFYKLYTPYLCTQQDSHIGHHVIKNNNANRKHIFVVLTSYKINVSFAVSIYLCNLFILYLNKKKNMLVF